MFTGEYRHAVDEKGRIAVPARFRAQLDGGLVVARWLDTCLAVYPRAAWEDLSTRVGEPADDRPDARRMLQRRLFAGPSRLSSTDRVGCWSRSPCGPSRAWRPRRWCWDPATTPRSGRPAAWDDYRKALDDAEAFATAIDGLGI